MTEDLSGKELAAGIRAEVAAAVLRVHDVAATRDVLSVLDAVAAV
jgi:dihydropteroate synthase